MVKKTWYIYKIEFSTEEFYIGYRGTTKLPDNDFLISYFSSSKEVKKRIKNNITYQGIILKIFDDKISAYNAEQDLIFLEINNPKLLNKFCYKNRKGYGILTEFGKQKISKSTKARWQDPLYKEKLSKSHKERWEDGVLKERQSKRLTGKKRPEHSKIMKGHPGHTKCKGIPKEKGFGAKVSASSKGIPKSEIHKQNLSLSAQNRTLEHRKKISDACNNSPKKECTYCLRLFDIRNYGRYHGIKCKLNHSSDLSK